MLYDRRQLTVDLQRQRPFRGALPVVCVAVAGLAADGLPVEVFADGVKGQDAPPLTVGLLPPPLLDRPAVGGGGTPGGGADTGQVDPPGHCGDPRVVRAGGTDDGGGGGCWWTENT